MLAPRHEINSDVFSMKFGRFRPKHRCNMDQVPLPFVVNQESTFTDENDKDVHISASSDALRKRQFTMRIVCNAGENVDDRDGHTVLIWKGSANDRRTTIEKNGWNKKVAVKFQKNTWVDTAVAEEIAADFVQHVKEKHGDALIVLSLDNMSAHFSETVKKNLLMDIFC